MTTITKLNPIRVGLRFIALGFMLDTAVMTAGLIPVLPPELNEGSGIIKDKGFAIALGKALFWDQQAGSHGMACASCHFSAGADSRIINQLSPGFKQKPEDHTFGSTAGVLGTAFMPSGSVAGPNYKLNPVDFPLHQLIDNKDRNSEIITTTNDRVSSSGEYDNVFQSVDPLLGNEACNNSNGEIFHAGPFPARQVEPRNTPTMINAIFNHRNFWDGRANNIFNGIGTFGHRDIDNNPAAGVLVANGPTSLQLDRSFNLTNASAASQAVGPPLSSFEMSCKIRTFPDLGRKLLNMRPLLKQGVHPFDSVLGKPGPHGDLRDQSGHGLAPQYLYRELIKRAFDDKYWNGEGLYLITVNEGTAQVTPSAVGYTQMEHNFSMFWGISIMLYEATLISDQAKVDRPEKMRPLEIAGQTIFRSFRSPTDTLAGGGRCTSCHTGPLFSSATEGSGQTGSIFGPLVPPSEFVPIQRANAPPTPPGGETALIRDTGFFNIGSRPVVEDQGVGDLDPYGNPLSFSRQFLSQLNTLPTPDHLAAIDPCTLGPPPFSFCSDIDPTIQRLSVDGAFKVPSLRNVALTPPYFHHGGAANLSQVLDFYSRGGNRRDFPGIPIVSPCSGANCPGGNQTSPNGDDSGTGPLGQTPIQVDGTIAASDRGRNTDSNIRQLHLERPWCTTSTECTSGAVPVEAAGIPAKELLIRFLKTLTDPRVQTDQAPFDHPQLFIFHGHAESDGDLNQLADDQVSELPAVGKDGYSANSPFVIPNEGDLFATGMRKRAGNF